MTPSDQLTYATVRLEILAEGKTIGYGTGFLMQFAASETDFVPAIVTNKHVVEGAETIKFRLTEMKNEKPSDKLVEFSVSVQPSLVAHPNSDIDLCAIRIGSALKDVTSSGTELFWRYLTFELVPSEEDWSNFDSIEDVVMIGCPNGICDEVNNTPISRRGISATPLHKKYNGKNEFLIDMACFPGSSGSPVFAYNEHSYYDRKLETRIMGQFRVLLLGILYQGPTIFTEGNVFLTQGPRVEMKTMMHLGHVIRSSELHVLDELIRKSLRYI